MGLKCLSVNLNFWCGSNVAWMKTRHTISRNSSALIVSARSIPNARHHHRHSLLNLIPNVAVIKCGIQRINLCRYLSPHCMCVYVYDKQIRILLLHLNIGISAIQINPWIRYDNHEFLWQMMWVRRVERMGGREEIGWFVDWVIDK